MRTAMMSQLAAAATRSTYSSTFARSKALRLVSGPRSNVWGNSGRRSINSTRLTIQKSPSAASEFEKRPRKEDLVFGTTLSSHMLMVEWTKETKWTDPRIVPLQDLKLSPAASSLHYGKSLAAVSSSSSSKTSFQNRKICALSLTEILIFRLSPSAFSKGYSASKG